MVCHDVVSLTAVVVVVADIVVVVIVVSPSGTVLCTESWDMTANSGPIAPLWFSVDLRSNLTLILVQP